MAMNTLCFQKLVYVINKERIVNWCSKFNVSNMSRAIVTVKTTGRATIKYVNVS